MKRSFSNDISHILPDLIRAKGWEVQLEIYDVFRLWHKLIGEEVAACSKPWKVERNVLWIEVENSAWLQQLQYQKVWILEEVNAFLKLSRLSDIRLILERSIQKPKKKEEPKVRFIPPSPEELEAFKKTTTWIADEKSRDALVNFWYLSQACKRE